jgi:methylenetetrahydrofolate reductase (NADPH)
MTAEVLLDDFSIEMTAKDVESLTAARETLPAGTAVSVTFLPGETMDARVAAAAAVRRLGFEPVPHISARRIGSEAELKTFLSRLRDEAAITRAFVVAGDPPRPEGPYEDALAVIRSGLLAEHGVRRVGVSGYPEGHPDIAEAALWRAMDEKGEVLAALGHDMEIVTQFGFDADPVLLWLCRLRDRGVRPTVRVGLPGPCSAKTLLRFAARCGVGASARVMKKYGVSFTKLLSPAAPDALLRGLADKLDRGMHGEVKVHLYPFGGLAKAADWAATYALERSEAA